jgi:hypothetical protein
LDGATAAGSGAGRGGKAARQVEGVVAGGGISWRRRCRAAAPWEGIRAGEEQVRPPRRGRGPQRLVTSRRRQRLFFAVRFSKDARQIPLCHAFLIVRMTNKDFNNFIKFIKISCKFEKIRKINTN